jgi:5-methylcytosine-specific restriction endonuclease McrA
MEKIPDIMSRDAAPWRRWYKTARWQQLRERILLRDMFICQRTGVMLIGKHPAPNSPVVDHVKPHRGDEALFWDESNLMSVSKAWHDKAKQAEEQASLQQRGVWH